MDARSFVESVKMHVRDTAIKGTYETAIDPPGRNPREIDKLIAKWLKSLSPIEKSYIQHLISEAVDAGLFDLFCVLDGVCKITDEPGNFILLFKDEDRAVKLNDPELNVPESKFLHDIFQSYRFED